MNVLLTSAGRRGYLVDFFKKAIGKDGLIHAGNSSAMSPAFYYADRQVVTPLIYDKEYIPFLLNYCKENKIDLVVSLFDVDLMMLAIHKGEFEKLGTKVLVSDSSVIDICNDKWNTYEFCKKNDINAPKTFKNINDVRNALKLGDVKFPIMVKPRWGMGSIAVFEACDEEELEVFYKKVKREIFDSYLKYESEVDKEECVLFQEKMCGQEFGLDIIHDMEKNHCLTVVRKKMAMRSGETDCAMVMKNSVVEDFGTYVGAQLGHIGNLDMDVFVVDEKPYLLELNARFGGGYPFSHFAGVDLPGAIVKWIKKEKLQDELVIKQYDQLVQKDIQLIDITKFC